MNELLRAIDVMAWPDGVARVFHGRGGRFPGEEHWVLDAYPPVMVLTSFAPVSDGDLSAIGAALERRWAQIAPPGAPLNWVFQARGEAARGAGQEATRLMAGSVPDPHVVTEAGTRYGVHVLRGQNHGLFLDMAEGRRWVREHVADLSTREGRGGRGAKVLNLFAYTCAFSVVALQAGAAQVVNMDMSRSALAIGQQNHRLNGIASGASFLSHDIFSSWGKLTRGGPYDLVIVDPPSYQKGSFVATKDYARLMRRLPDLLAPGGHALLCLNAPELGPEFLDEAMREQAPELQRVGRLPNPPAFADRDEARSLKAIVYRAPG